MRENLLKAAEKRLEGRVAELKELEARVNTAMQQKDEAEAARFKNLVTMYENMKAKDAAKIFDRPRPARSCRGRDPDQSAPMSDILAQMSPEAAERLTVELANRAARTSDETRRSAEDRRQADRRIDGCAAPGRNVDSGNARRLTALVPNAAP